MQPIFEASGPALDRYFNKQNAIERLIADYNKHGHLIVAYDFDETVYPWDGGSCDQVIELLQVCSKIPTIDMVVFTCRGPSERQMVEDYLNSKDIRHDAINENVDRVKSEFGDGRDSKVLYSIFLDDRAGLSAAYETLVGFLEWYYREVVN